MTLKKKLLSLIHTVYVQFSAHNKEAGEIKEKAMQEQTQVIRELRVIRKQAEHMTAYKIARSLGRL